MGKVADNEQRKLRATFWNNLAVGAVLAGIVIPYLSYFTKSSPNDPSIFDFVSGKVPWGLAWLPLLAWTFTMATAFVCAVFFRRLARINLKYLED